MFAPCHLAAPDGTCPLNEPRRNRATRVRSARAIRAATVRERPTSPERKRGGWHGRVWAAMPGRLSRACPPKAADMPPVARGGRAPYRPWVADHCSRAVAHTEPSRDRREPSCGREGADHRRRRLGHHVPVAWPRRCGHVWTAPAIGRCHTGHRGRVAWPRLRGHAETREQSMSAQSRGHATDRPFRAVRPQGLQARWAAGVTWNPPHARTRAQGGVHARQTPPTVRLPSDAHIRPTR